VYPSITCVRETASLITRSTPRIQIAHSLRVDNLKHDISIRDTTQHCYNAATFLLIPIFNWSITLTGLLDIVCSAVSEAFDGANDSPLQSQSSGHQH
jgi:hypothetical protein